MADTTRELPAGYREFATFDSRTNPVNRRVSYILHFASAIFFVPLFAAVTVAVRPGRPLDPVDLWSVSVPGLGIIGALALMFFAVVVVINGHMLLHAAAIRYLGGAEPRITPRRITVSVSSPDWLVPKKAMVLIAVAPFFVISALGAIAMSVVSSSALGWIFVPLVANGITTAGDVLTLSWIFVTPADALFRYDGASLTAYAPPGRHG
ncbi:MAG: DUF3267 domain-containing protein [Spirochaetaceae bacterium]